MRKIAGTCGVFDIIHEGHVSILEACARLADEVVVFVNSDTSTRRLRGPGKPFAPFTARSMILEALAAVTSVIRYEENTPVEELRRFFARRPEATAGNFFWLKDSQDYAASGIPEAAVVREYGGIVLYYESPFPESRTSKVVERIKEALNESMA